MISFLQLCRNRSLSGVTQFATVRRHGPLAFTWKAELLGLFLWPVSWQSERPAIAVDSVLGPSWTRAALSMASPALEQQPAALQQHAIPRLPSRPRPPDASAIRRAVDRRPIPDWFTIIFEAQRPPPVDADVLAEVRHELCRALHQAARHDLPEHAGLLLSRGAPLEACASDPYIDWEDDEDLGSPLLACAEWRRGSERAARVILAAGARVRGGDAAAIFERAVRHGHVGLLRLLVEFGADVDERSSLGWTALHTAAKLGLVAVARVLISELGADVMARTRRGEAVEDVARRHSKAQFIEWLYLSEHLRPAEGTNPIVKRCHAAAFQTSDGVYGL